MVNKKANKGYCRAYRQKKGDVYKARDAARKKKMKEKEEKKSQKKYQVFKKKKLSVLENSVDVRATTGQHCSQN